MAGDDNVVTSQPSGRSEMRFSRRQSSRQPSRSKIEHGSSPYDVTLYVRSHNPVADAIDVGIDSEDLPDHHVFTLASSVARVAGGAGVEAASFLHGGSRPASPSVKNRLLSKRSSKSSLGRASPAHGRSVSHSKSHASSQKANGNLVSLLTFKNPWESFKAPGVWDMVNGGLQWGLPEAYDEGAGHGKWRGMGKHLETIQAIMDKAKEVGLRKDWDAVEVLKPDWGIGDEPQEEVDEDAAQDHAPNIDEPLEDSPDGDSAPGPDGDEVADGFSQTDTPAEPALVQDEDEKAASQPDADSARITWLGHATALLQLPSLLPGWRSYNVLWDPIFSERCSPSQTAGPIRFTPSPCAVEDLPPIDLILLSHNHYDHLDYDTVRALLKRHGQALHVCVPLGNKSWFVGAGFKAAQVTELDWWDEADIKVLGALANTAVEGHISGTGQSPTTPPSAHVRVICTPAQHGSGRGGGDKAATLWSSWVVEHVRARTGPGKEKRFRAFFAGDTGLRYHNETIKGREHYPVCPAFGEITSRYGAPHLLLLPISVGSSLSYFRSWDPFPRRFSPFPRVSEALTSAIHMDAEDAVECFDIMRGDDKTDDSSSQSAQQPRTEPVALAVHVSAVSVGIVDPLPNSPALIFAATQFGTFVRNDSQTRADVRSLFSACVRHGVRFLRTEHGKFNTEGTGTGKGTFLVAHQGETVWVPMK